MPFHEYISTKFGATIVLWQLTENEQTITTLLSEKERNLIDSQNLSPKRFCERAASRLSLNRIKETLNDDITYTAEGKPHLLRKSGHISISHTKEWVAVAYHPFLPIGIDIERIGEKIEKVAPRVFNAPELNISSGKMATHLLVGKRSPFQSYTRDWDRLSGTLAYRSYPPYRRRLSIGVGDPYRSHKDLHHLVSHIQ